MPNARDDHKRAQNKTPYIKEQEEECDLQGVSQKRGCVGRGTPLFEKYPKFSGLYSAVLLRGWNRRVLSDSILANGLQRCGGAEESAAAGIRVCYLDSLFSGL